MPRVVIVGGGISGLSAAYYLAQAGVGSTIVEPRPRLGGVIRTERVEGCLVEAGPDSFLAAKPAAMELIKELGLAGDVIGSNDHLRVTFVRRDGRLVPLPDGLMMMVPTRILPLVTTGLLSWNTKLRMGLELLRAPRPPQGDESVADFVRAHYGQEAVDYLAEPLLAGVYGGDPALMSVTSVLPRFVELAARHGSLTRGVLAARAQASRTTTPPPLFRTLKGGLGQLVEAVEKSIESRVVQARAESIDRTGSGFRVRARGETIEADHVVLACEAHNAAPLAAGLDGRLAELLSGVEYNSSTIVVLGYEAADFAGRPPAGFGFLVPKVERRMIAACTWVGTKFSHRVPDGKIVARCFLGGAEGDDDTLVTAVSAELQQIAGFRAEPRFTRVFRWPKAMAQYAVGHPARAKEMRERVAAIPGLHVAGNAYDGIGVPDCIRLGKSAAEKIAAKHRKPH